MRKRSGPPLTIKEPKLVNCSICNGWGKYKKMFYEVPCDHCDANGEVEAETGNPVSKETMVFVLKKRLRQKEAQIAFLESKDTSDSKNKGHWDEFKTMNGGKQRFD